VGVHSAVITFLQVDPYNIVKNPFITIAQAQFKKLLTMPHWAFARLAHELGDPNYKNVSMSFAHKMAVQ
jgi:hypothetical protein